VERAIGMLVDTAAEQARHAARSAVEETARFGGSVREHAGDLAGEASRRAGNVAETLSPSAIPVAALKASARRRQRRQRRQRRRNQRSGPPLALIVIGALIGVAVIAVIVRRRTRAQAGAGPAPDAFGTAVDLEREAANDGQVQRPVTTPGG
jgi:hypothetical protein